MDENIRGKHTSQISQVSRHYKQSLLGISSKNPEGEGGGGGGGGSGDDMDTIEIPTYWAKYSKNPYIRTLSLKFSVTLSSLNMNKLLSYELY